MSQSPHQSTQCDNNFLFNSSISLALHKVYWRFSASFSSALPISAPWGHLVQSRQPGPGCWYRKVLSATLGKGGDGLWARNTEKGLIPQRVYILSKFPVTIAEATLA